MDVASEDQQVSVRSRLDHLPPAQPGIAPEHLEVQIAGDLQIHGAV